MTEKTNNISEEHIDRIKSANIANILKKLKAGRTLTAAELKLIDEARGGVNALTTLEQICNLFGVTRKTVALWRKEGRDCPKKVEGKESISAWRQWFEDNPSAGSTKNNPGLTREELICEKHKREIALLDIKVAEARREVIPASEVEEILSYIASRQRAELIRFANTEAVTLAGKLGGEAAVARSVLDGLVDRQCTIMAEAVARFLEAMQNRKPKQKETDDN